MWDKTSISPLISTNDAGISGFLALNPLVGQLTPGEYAQTFGPLEHDNPVDTPWFRQGAMDHIQGRKSPDRHLRSGPSALLRNRMDHSRQLDHRSPWIPTTRCLDWAIWRVARSLTLHPNIPVNLTVISLSCSAAGPEQYYEADTLLTAHRRSKHHRLVRR